MATPECAYLIRNATFSDFLSIEALLKSGQTNIFGPTRRKCNDANYFFKNYASHRMLVVDPSSLDKSMPGSAAPSEIKVDFRSRHGTITSISTIPGSATDAATGAKIIGYAEFTNFPLIEALPKDCWMDWLQHHFCLPLPVNSTNTLFFSTFIFHKKFMPTLLHIVLEECFLREQKLKYIIGVEMPYQKYNHIRDQPHYYVLKKYSKVFYPKSFNVLHCKNVQRIHIIERSTIISHLHSRMALPEDNDEVVDIINYDRPEISEACGDFFIAEELLRADEHRNSIIVSEISNSISSFLWLNDNVDLMRLAVNFDLETFGHLMKFSRHTNHSQILSKVQVLTRKTSIELFTTPNIMGKIDDLIESSTSTSETSSELDKNPEEVHARPLAKRFFKKCLKITELLTSKDHYVKKKDKYLLISFNVQNIDDEEPTPDAANVFAMQLMGLHETIDIRRTFNLLEIAFTVYPDLDYCLLSFPADTKFTMTLIEMLNYFIPIEPRISCEIKENLYVTHRSAIYGYISLHPIRPEDIPDIDNVLQYKVHRPTGIPSSFVSDISLGVISSTEYEYRTVHRILDEIFEDPFSEYSFFSVRCGDLSRPIDENPMIGYVIVRNFTQIEHLVSHFKVPFFRADLGTSCAEVLTLRLHPFFHFEADTVFRELARFTNYWDFFYLMPLRSYTKVLTNELILRMQPIEPRRIKKFVHPPTDAHDNSYAIGHFAVFRNNLSPTRFFGNTTSICVIGFSDVCRAFLRLMTFGWNTEESQNTKMHCCVPRLKITVVTKPGVIEAEHDNNFHCNICSDPKDCWINRENSNDFIQDTVKRMDLRIWVDFVAGNLKSIDREKQMVVLDSKCDIYYDTLLLFAENKFGVPKQLHPNEKLPPNYMHVNNRLNKITLYHKIQALLYENARVPQRAEKLRILIYGSHLHTFEFINFLLNHKVPAKSITLVWPFWVEEAIWLQKFSKPHADNNIEMILLTMVEDLGVKLYERYLFAYWERYDGDANIASVVFEKLSEDPELKLKCDLFISFFENPMEPQLGQVLKHANIKIISNRIKVDADFRTNDRNIYAFGKYIEHTHIPNHQYEYVNPMEAAEKIIHILKLNVSPQKSVDNTIKFLKPSFFQARLPLGYRLTKIILPNRYIANLFISSPTMSSFCDDDFCRVGLNQHGFVNQILIITRKNLHFDYLQYFVGQHELLLNCLRSNCYLSEIQNFLEFFQQPWTELIKHDNFQDLQWKVRDLVMEPAMELLNLGVDRFNRLEMVKHHLEESGITKQVEIAFLNFLRKYRNDFKHPFALPEDFENAL